jgi:hypothetical protein
LARLLMLGPGLSPGEVELIEDVRTRGFVSTLAR